MNDIAHRLLLETNTVTPLLQRMEKQGIVARKKGEQDKRQQIVTLTDKGAAMEQKAHDLIPDGMGKRLSACPLRAEDYTLLAQQLDALIESLHPTLTEKNESVKSFNELPKMVGKPSNKKNRMFHNNRFSKNKLLKN